jgi:hypothetical protein
MPGGTRVAISGEAPMHHMVQRRSLRDCDCASAVSACRAGPAETFMWGSRDVFPQMFVAPPCPLEI